MTRFKYLMESLRQAIKEATEPKKPKGIRGWLQKPKPGITSLASLLAVIVAAASLYYTVDSGIEMASLLEGLNSSFEETKKGLVELPRSIGKFDSTVSEMSNIVDAQQENFSRSLDSLESHLSAFSGSLEDYKDVIDSTISAYNRHLELLDKQQAQIAEQLNRKSELKMSFEISLADSGFWKVQPHIRNIGNATTSFFHYFFEMPDSFNFVGKAYSSTTTNSGWKNYTYIYNSYVGFEPPDIGKGIDCSPVSAGFILKTPPANNKFVLKYVILYDHGAHKDSVLLRTNM